IDRLPSGSCRARLMIDGRRYTATSPTETDAHLWEIATRAAVAERRGAPSVTVGAYAEGWSAGFIGDAPDRARFEAALQDRLVTVLREWPLFEVLGADRNEPYGQVIDVGGDGHDEATRECLQLILEDAVEDLRAGVGQGVLQSRSMGRTWMRSSAR
ncbi:MAG: hypothetical protein ACQEUI_13475, partial [Actinomycetota bacterium]